MQGSLHCPLGAGPAQHFLFGGQSGLHWTASGTQPATHPPAELLPEQQCWPAAQPLVAMLRIRQVWLSPGFSDTRPLGSQPPLIKRGAKNPGSVDSSPTVTVGLPVKDSQGLLVSLKSGPATLTPSINRSCDKVTSRVLFMNTFNCGDPGSTRSTLPDEHFPEAGLHSQ